MARVLALILNEPADAAEAFEAAASEQQNHQEIAWLRGVAELLQLKVLEALEFVRPAGDIAAANNQALGVFALFLQQLGRAELRGDFLTLAALMHQRGVRDPAWSIVQAHEAISEGSGQAAEEFLVAAAAEMQERAWPLILAPLQRLIEQQQALAQARLNLLNGKVAKTESRLAWNGSIVWPGVAEWFAAGCALHRGDIGLRSSRSRTTKRSFRVRCRRTCTVVLLHVRERRFAEAEQHILAVRAKVADHPFARLADAERLEQLGRHAKAVAAFEELAGKNGLQPDRRIAVVACLALGRIEQQAGQLTCAIEHFQQARALDPQCWPAARRAIFAGLLVPADDPLRQALKESLLQANTRRGELLTCLAVAMWQQHEQAPLVLDALEHALDHPEFCNLPATIRHSVVLWTSALQVGEGNLGKANMALARLAENEIDAHIRGRRRQLGIVHAKAVLSLVPIAPNAADDLRRVADNLLQLDSQDAVAQVIALLAMILANQDDLQAVADRVKSIPDAPCEKRNRTWVQEMVRLIEAIVQPSTQPFGNDEARQLFVANFTRGLDRVLVTADRALEVDGQLPVSAGALAMVRAAQLAGKSEAAAVDWLATCRDRGIDDTPLRRLHALLIARRAVGLIRSKMLRDADQALRDAVALCPPLAEEPELRL